MLFIYLAWHNNVVFYYLLAAIFLHANIFCRVQGLLLDECPQAIAAGDRAVVVGLPEFVVESNYLYNI